MLTQRSQRHAENAENDRQRLDASISGKSQLACEFSVFQLKAGNSVAASANKTYRVFKRHAVHYVSILTEADRLYVKGGDGINQGLT